MFCGPTPIMAEGRRASLSPEVNGEGFQKLFGGKKQTRKTKQKLFGELNVGPLDFEAPFLLTFHCLQAPGLFVGIRPRKGIVSGTSFQAVSVNEGICTSSRQTPVMPSTKQH